MRHLATFNWLFSKCGFKMTSEGVVLFTYRRRLTQFFRNLVVFFGSSFYQNYMLEKSNYAVVNIFKIFITNET